MSIAEFGFHHFHVLLVQEALRTRSPLGPQNMKRALKWNATSYPLTDRIISRLLITTTYDASDDFLLLCSILIKPLTDYFSFTSN
jgi:hypothetical protein